MVQDELTHERLAQVLDYNPETGLFSWKIATSSKIRPGAIAGKVNNRGYQSIKIDKKDYLAHRLAWMYVNREWPKNIIDHINGDRLDNRISNIRDTTYSVNNSNRKKANGYQVVGKKFCARITLNNKCIYLGAFETPEAARQAYLVAKKQLHFS